MKTLRRGLVDSRLSLCTLACSFVCLRLCLFMRSRDGTHHREFRISHLRVITIHRYFSSRRFCGRLRAHPFASTSRKSPKKDGISEKRLHDAAEDCEPWCIDVRLGNRRVSLLYVGSSLCFLTKVIGPVSRRFNHGRRTGRVKNRNGLHVCGWIKIVFCFIFSLRVTWFD